MDIIQFIERNYADCVVSSLIHMGILKETSPETQKLCEDTKDKGMLDSHILGIIQKSLDKETPKFSKPYTFLTSDKDGQSDRTGLGDAWKGMVPNSIYLIHMRPFMGDHNHMVLAGLTEEGVPYIYDSQRILDNPELIENIGIEDIKNYYIEEDRAFDTPVHFLIYDTTLIKDFSDINISDKKKTGGHHAAGKKKKTNKKTGGHHAAGKKKIKKKSNKSGKTKKI
jgi:hypothetical protein